jgi:hypothetical protein
MNLNFVLCPSYHGATLLALLLNNHTKISSLGDAVPRKTYDQRCACGKLVSQCEFWQKIEKALAVKKFVGQDALLPMYPRVYKNQQFNKIFNQGLGLMSLYLGPQVWKSLGRRGYEYAQMYLKFYHTVCDLHGTEIFAQGSKNLIEVLVLKSLLGKKASLKIIHLSRDPRAYFHSRKKYYPSTTIRFAASKWKSYHRMVAKLQHSLGDTNYLFLRYEDLCREPSKRMREVFDFLHVDYQDVCHAPSNPRKHHLMGNKMLFSFHGTIQGDYSWQDRVPYKDQITLLERTQPFSARFGYTTQPEDVTSGETL